MSSDPRADRGEGGLATRGAAGPVLHSVAAYWWVVLLVTLATVAGGVAYVAHRTPRYTADVQVLFTPLSSGDGAQGLPLVVSSADPTRDAQTGVTLIGGPKAAALTARRLGPGWTARQVTSDTAVEQTGQSNIIAVEGRAQSPVLATRLANQFAGASLDVRRAEMRRDALAISRTLPASPNPNDTAAQAQRAELSLVLSGADPNFSIQGPAGSASSTATPAAAILPLAGLGGIALGIVAAILLDIFSNRIRDADELHELYPVPVVGSLPRLPRRERASIQKHVVSDTLIAPAHLLAGRLLGRARAGKVLLATGASAGDGTTTVTLHLARALVASGRQVLLMDCDLATAGASRQLGVDEDRPGLTELLDGEASLSECATWAPALPELRLLPAGHLKRSRPRDRRSSARLGKRLGNVIQDARKLADYVLVDTAPLIQQSDMVAALADVDRIVVVARPGHTRRADFSLLRDLLDASRSAPVGLVVVGERSWQGQARVTPAKAPPVNGPVRPARAASAAVAGRGANRRQRATRTDGTTAAENRPSEA